MSSSCPLCLNAAILFLQKNKFRYLQCQTCYGIFLDKKQYPSLNTELAHYCQHINDIEDKDYQQFVSPITNAIRRDFTANDKGLDFGAGTGPVISKVLKDRSYQIDPYDPLFHNTPYLLDATYNYIACCEVIEHFHQPGKEFTLLRKLLLPHGKLYCMTHLYDETINFENWYYKNDPTHVFIYHQNTIHWIKENFEFASVRIEERLITFSS